MIYISHRGNLLGPNHERENSPSYLIEAVEKGFQVEVDVRVIDNRIFLGHDFPQYEVDIDFLKNPYFYLHAKNLGALQLLTENYMRCFWHQTDNYTLTSEGLIWSFPNQPLSKNSIAVMPEQCPEVNWSEAAGVCSDYVAELKRNYTKKRAAVFFVGETRTFTVTADSLLKNIVLVNGADVFMCLTAPVESIPELRVQLENIYHPKALVFTEENPDLVKEEEEMYNKALGRSHQKENAIQVRQWCKVLECFRLMLNYERENKISYTHMIKTRLDFTINRPLVINNFDTNNTIVGWEDIIFFGDRHSINVCSNMAVNHGTYKWNSSNEQVLGYKDKSIEFIPEIQFRRHLHDNNIGYSLLQQFKPWFEMSLVRRYSEKPSHGIIVPYWLN